MDLNKKIIKLCVLNEFADEDLILSIITNFTMGKVSFEKVRNAKCLEFPKEN